MSRTTFGKPGRPREDRLLRQREIFLAVAPIVMREGVRAVTMRRAARAAHLSVGGLYHYFPDRRSMLLHGARPEAMTRLCTDFFGGDVAYRTDRNTWSMAARFVDFQVEELRLVRPALRAAVELGSEEFAAAVHDGIHRGTREFVEALERVLPDAHQRDLESLSRSIRRLVLGAALDRDPSESELREALRALLARSFRRSRRVVAGAAIGLPGPH